MEQKQLYRTLENAFKQFPELENERQLLSYVLNEIINHEEINIIGGRIWALNDSKNAYKLIEQQGEVEKIRKGYELNIEEYPMFLEVGKNRSVLTKETDNYLSNLGITKYSATGIGDRIKIKNLNGSEDFLYQYILAINSNDLDINQLNTMNIISTSVSAMLRTRRVETKAKAFEKELIKAKEIQQSILPDHEFVFSHYEIYGISLPDKIVGGDFFDYISFEETQRIGIAIGDAASKGFSAAAQALYVSGALKMGTENELKMTTVVKKINNLVFRTFPYDRFVTLIYLELYADSKGLCQYVNAGHNKPILLRYKTDEFETMDPTGPVLGPSPNQNYLTDSFYFNMYDTLILYTDGIVEAANNKFEFYGEDRLRQVLLNSKHFPARTIAANIIEDVQKYSSRGKYSDDKTVVVIKRIK